MAIILKKVAAKCLLLSRDIQAIWDSFHEIIKIFGLACTFNSAAPGSSSKHAIYALIICSQVCAVFHFVL